MKLTKYLAGFAIFAFAATSHADVTVNITGANAFRAATINAIKAQYLLGNGTVSFKYAHDKGAGLITGSTRSIFIGNFPGVTGTTTIRCCFTGSVEGVRAMMTEVTDPSPPTYLAASVLTGTTATAGGAELPSTSTPVAALGTTSDIAFSDVGKDSTPYGRYAAFEDQVGVIVFSMVTNNGASANLTSVNTQQYRCVLGKGPEPLSLFTGLTADDTSYVIAMGRSDLSGTRTTYLAETGFGFVNPVQQYVLNTYSGTAMTRLQLVPASGISTLTPAGNGNNCSTTGNASTVRGQSMDGNGGYSSGGDIATAMSKTGSAVTVYGASGSDQLGGAKNVALISWVGISDAMTIRNNGGRIIGYNGVTLSDLAAGGTQLGDNDKAKISRGQYTAWGYERIFRNRNLTSGDKLTVYTAVFGELPNQIGSAGMAKADLLVGREVDGGVVAP